MPSTPSIVVIGSSNMDLVAKVPQIPVVGETLLGTDFFMVPGGKGANQAVAATKLGGNVVFLTRLGNDMFAEALLKNFRSVGINTRHIRQLDDVPTGIAMIAIDGSGQNAIMVVPGANFKLTPEDILKVEPDIAAAGVVVVQLEIPIETVTEAARTAQKYNVPFILDPAPAQPLNDQLLGMVDIIKPNEVEAYALTGIRITDRASAEQAADVFLGKGVKSVIITLGEKGFVLATCEKKQYISTLKVNAVDSTAAGDAFTGALAYCLAGGKSLSDAALYANAVAAVSVTRRGAQSSLPTSEEVSAFMADHAADF